MRWEMKRFLSAMLVLMILVAGVSAQELKPYTLGAVSSESFAMVREMLRTNLDSAGFSVLGEYAPAKDDTRWVFIVNSEPLVKAVQSVGGLTGFAVVLRVALTQEDEKVLVSYTNPSYWGNAYFQKSYPKVAHYYDEIEKQLDASMLGLGDIKYTAFGAEEGLDAGDLRHYHYMFGMEYFEDVVELNDYSNFAAGKQIIEAKLVKGGDTDLVYAYEIPGQDLKLYGVALGGDTGEGHFLPIIDISKPRHTAFLPYEVLLKGNTAVMLHGRYRIALSFPDLTMTTFGKIMSTPGDIEDLMRSITE